MNYPNDFYHYGFLSAESERTLASALDGFAEQFLLVREQVREAYSGVYALPQKGTISEIAGLTLWLRSLEAVQGAIILIDRGMPGTAMAAARTGWECLFYACALWNRPELLQRLTQAHEHERLQQIKQVLNTAGAVLPLEQVTLLESYQNEPVIDSKKWSAWDAATAAGLAAMYETHYRGLGLGGAHASERSLDRHFVDDNVTPTLTFNPDFRPVGLVLVSASQCLSIGIDRFNEHFFANTGSISIPPIAPAL